MNLLTRDEFREKVFNRDNNKCVLCNSPAQDAHHIMERKLWSDGGYYLDNGASLCAYHHILAEQTNISCEEIRSSISAFDKVMLPPHLYKDEIYDKWGNIILPNKYRLKGELFYDVSVQKILELGNVLGMFVDYVKYPRTYHLPWSEGITKDDRVLINCDNFVGKHVIVTIKMDGENTTIYNNYIHARSVDYHPHFSRDWVKNLQSQIGYNIPKGYRICGENLFAKHSIKYNKLPSYFMVFSIWNDKNVCLSWKETKEWAELLGLQTVPIIYDGIWDENIIKKLYNPVYNEEQCEGYVVRLYEEYNYGSFRNCVAKFVRKNHITTHGHWMRSFIEQNKMENIK
jgi:hypothetical protein